MIRKFKVHAISEAMVDKEVEIDGAVVTAKVPCANVELVSDDGLSAHMHRFVGQKADELNLVEGDSVEVEIRVV